VVSERTCLQLVCSTALNGQLVEQRSGLFQIECIEALREPAVDRSEQITGFIPLALIAPETGEAGGGRSFRGTAPCPSQLLAELEGT
jgi:hypothetical protein